MRFGANYVPSKGWFYSWMDSDVTSTREDFIAIKDIGFDHIRLHLRWDLFQPNPSYYPDCVYDKLEKMLAIAEEVGLDVYITVFTGWMSGFWFMPSYIRDMHAITNDEMVKYECKYIDRLAERVVKHKSFCGIDLGNEFNVYQMFIKDFKVEEGDKWLNYMTNYVMDKFPGKEVVLGVDHQPWFGDVQFSRKCLATTGTLTSLHTWIEFTGARGFGQDSTEVFSLPEFNVELANAYADDLDRKVWLQEFGVIRTWLDESKYENFVRTTIFNALRSDNIWGFTWWCSHDINQEFDVIHPMEKEFGLLTVNNELKPLGKYVKECIADVKKGINIPQLKSDVAIVIDESKPFYGWDYGRAYARLIEEGIHAKFVLSSKCEDEEYLNKRNIKELIRI